MPPAIAPARKLCLRLATSRDRRRIHQLRHDVYAEELGQHACNEAGELRDALDAFNEYLVVAQGDEICGFVSVTPPGHGHYSLDKYLPRDEWPFPIDDGLFEMRLLTVPRAYRSGPYAALLMHAARRYLHMRSATRAMAIGRREVIHLYEKIGFRPLGRSFHSGSVEPASIPMCRGLNHYCAAGSRISAGNSTAPSCRRNRIRRR
jgi:GNAT superfamily N-acetyltransferase